MVRKRIVRILGIFSIILAVLLLLLAVVPLILPIPPLKNTVPPQQLADADSHFFESSLLRTASEPHR